MLQRRTFVVTTVVLGIAGYYYWWVFWSGDNFRSHSSNAANRDAIVRLHEALRPNDDRTEVLEKYWSHRTTDLRLHLDSPDAWVVSMPLEFGAGDWNLRIEFRNGRLSAVRIRTADGPAPREAPPDKSGT